MNDSTVITAELARGTFTDEMLEKMRSLIGTELRTDACVNNEYATRLAILRFAEGIGDDNPLWTDPAYAASDAARNADRAAELYLLLPGLCPGRLEGPRRLPRRYDDDLPSNHPRGRPDHGTRLLRRLRRARSRATSADAASRIICGRSTAIRTTSSWPRSSARACVSSGRRCRNVPALATQCRCRIPGPTQRSRPSRSKCWPRPRAVRRRATGTMSRWATRSTSSPRDRLG